MSWFDIKIRFEAETPEQADDLLTKVVMPLCLGEGEGEAHVCSRKFYAELTAADQVNWIGSKNAEEENG